MDNIVGMMNDTDIPRVPAALEGILRDTGRIGFTMASEQKTGSLLRTLAASKPAGRFLELGTGTGVGTSWILAGMDAGSKLDSIDNDPATQEIARRHLGPDSRVTFHVVDGADFLERSDIEPYDFVYADSWPGKFSHLDHALGLLRAGGIYLIDDLLPQANWPPGHDVNVTALIDELQAKRGFVAVKLAWATGLMMVCREG